MTSRDLKELQDIYSILSHLEETTIPGDSRDLLTESSERLRNILIRHQGDEGTDPNTIYTT